MAPRAFADDVRPGNRARGRPAARRVQRPHPDHGRPPDSPCAARILGRRTSRRSSTARASRSSRRSSSSSSNPRPHAGARARSRCARGYSLDRRAGVCSPRSTSSRRTDPDAPTPDSLQRWRRARKPLQVDFVGEFVYDAGEDRFRDIDGAEVTPAAMLEYVYEAHCRTLRTWFVWKLDRGVVRPLDRAPDRVGRRGRVHVAAVALLRHRAREATRGEISPFHRFEHADFVRSAEKAGQGSTFFGFQSSRKNLISNLFVLAGLCYAAASCKRSTGTTRSRRRRSSSASSSLTSSDRSC